MNDIRKITVIEPTHLTEDAGEQETLRKIRVAAYARVSTEQDEQQSSYAAQLDYYTRYIQSNPNWEFVRIFADEGTTGTNIKKRDGFNQMIDLALSGGIDLILTKSISRFARNTVDSLQTVRKLKDIGVGVIFEKENLHTLDPKCEVMLTIMSSLAQEESRSISENIIWGQRKSMKDGKIHLAYSRFLGYRKGPDGRPEIVEDEAKIIRRIYSMFLDDGRTINEIAKALTADHIPTPAGREKWSVSTVRSILSNEKYKGEALLQKTYTVDYLTKEVRKNTGQKTQFLVEHSHEPIIEPSVFDLVQKKLAKRTALGAKYQSSHPFACTIICGDCGGFYGHKVRRNRNNTERYDVWYCNQKYGNAEVCRTPVLREADIRGVFEAALKKRGEDNPTYSDKRWRGMVESVTVTTNRRIQFLFSDGKKAEIAL